MRAIVKTAAVLGLLIGAAFEGSKFQMLSVVQT
jgi:5-(carboxyamino)imidazole ribonucleotide mutase